MLRRIDFPPQSPDLNPIEQIWALLGSRLPTNLKFSNDAMWRLLNELWNEVTTEELHAYISNMPRRLQDVIAVKGQNTRY